MDSWLSGFLFFLKYFFLPERSLNPGLDAPVIARIKDGFEFIGTIKALLWIVISIFLTFLIAEIH